ncbi:MAG: N-formylglutamate deformylase [Proteobacteria bacterium]|nr:N-formylglutamate deformylase [Pseudomonadota bacterium]
MIEVLAGTTPLVISLPHVGRGIPGDIAARMTSTARTVPDTDWNVDCLYSFARKLGCAWLQPGLSRYVVDLNRPPDDAALYPGQVSTGLCPTQSFDGASLYLDAVPDAAEVASRRGLYWAPYHAALRALLAAAISRHGYAVLLDAHSIRAEVPRLFSGRLPDINVGTNAGASCALSLGASVMQRLAAQSSFSSVLDGRFKGGYITRHYGAPLQQVHALQIELAQSGYMDEADTDFKPARAAALIDVLAGVVDVLLAFQPA